jgi:hypothetical protein
VKLQISSAEAFLTIMPLFNLFKLNSIHIYMHAVDNTQQLFLAIIYLKKFVLAVVVALPSYTLKVPNICGYDDVRRRT